MQLHLTALFRCFFLFIFIITFFIFWSYFLNCVLLRLDSCNVSSERHLQIKCLIHNTVMVRTINTIISVLLPSVMKDKLQSYFCFLGQGNNLYPQDLKKSCHCSNLLELRESFDSEMNTGAFHAPFFGLE